MLPQPENVTWSTVGAPSLISSKFSVVLDGSTLLCLGQLTPLTHARSTEVLASGFDPLAGFVTVMVNNTIPAGKYQLTRKPRLLSLHNGCP
jgi:hypothetical protein